MDLSSVRERFKEDDIYNAEMEKCISILAKIYIGQNVREQGVLSIDFRGNGKFDPVSILKEYSLVEEDKWYSHDVLKTTDEGEEAAREVVQERINEQINEISLSINYDGKIMSFLLYNYIGEGTSFPKHDQKARDWKRPLLEEDRVWYARNQLFESLLEFELAVEAHHYVSTRGGEKRETRYVISEEVREALRQQAWPEYEAGVDYDVKRKCEAYRLLKTAPNILDSENTEDSRERYWERLQDSSLDEEVIEEIINDLSSEGVTTEYRGLLSDSLPFEIKNESGFQTALKKQLITPVITEFFEDSSDTKNKRMKAIKEGKLPDKEIEILRKLSQVDHSPFENQEEHIQTQIEAAVELYEDGYWSEFLLRINNVCEDLVMELYQQRGTEFSADIGPLLENSHRPRIEALGNFPFISDNNPLKYRLLSIHLDRVNSDAAHGGESQIIMAQDARRTIFDFLNIYISIREILN